MSMFIPHPKPSKEERALFELIEGRVFFIRGRRVMLSTHLAGLYEVEARVLVQAVKRNKDRFPHSLMFQLNAIEFSALKSQFVISKYNNVRRSLPYAFNEQGVVMLASILRRSKRAIAMNAAIVRVFVHPHRPYLKARFVGAELW
jgi:hypothetical protein